ncbi:MAG: LarC family nickel insertion protein [Holophagaceae bacterium]|nr:LarC family nickel insertion protein [Holophagaceae bacterium]
MSQQQLWVDPFSGLSGDIWIGGWLALGVPEAELRAVLSLLPFDDLGLRVDEAVRCGIQGTKASVVIGGRVDEGQTEHVDLEAGARRATSRRKAMRLGGGDPPAHGLAWKEIDALLKKHLPSRIGEVARSAFEKLGLAEARVHGLPLGQVHFHEVGMKDSIADMALASAGWIALEEPTTHIGSIALGRGRTKMAHGDFPIPAPAALFLLEGFETHPGVAPLDKELTTPTGAALAAQLATHRKAPARFIPQRSAFAAGGWDFKDSPNVCRFTLGEVPGASAALLQLETNLDDATPQQVAHAQALLMEHGALDVWITAATFKKGRSGWVLGMILEPSRLEPLTRIIGAELPTLGLRYWPLHRLEADRRFSTADVDGESVLVKEGSWEGITQRHPEFEDARRAAEKLNQPLRDVQKKAEEGG